RIGSLVAGDGARRHGVGLGGPGLGQERGSIVVVSDDAVEDLLAALVEVVVPQAACEAEPWPHGERRLAERGVLPQIVREVGPEEVVLGRIESLREAVGAGWLARASTRSAKDGRREGVESVYEQVLRVV